MGPISLFCPRHDRFLHRVSESGSLLLRSTLLHLPGVRVRRAGVAVSADGTYPVLCISFSGTTGRIPGCFQCKHVLATLIAERLSKCVVREMGKDEFVALLTRQNLDT